MQLYYKESVWQIRNYLSNVQMTPICSYSVIRPTTNYIGYFLNASVKQRTHTTELSGECPVIGVNCSGVTRYLKQCECCITYLAISVIICLSEESTICYISVLDYYRTITFGDKKIKKCATIWRENDKPCAAEPNPSNWGHLKQSL